VIAGDRLRHLDQVALATDRPAVDLRVFGAHDRTEGRLPFLEPGEQPTTRIAIEAEELA
jgi:hypothetical protein